MVAGSAGKGKQRNRALASLAAVIRALRTEDGSESVDTRVEIGLHLADARRMLPRGQDAVFVRRGGVSVSDGAAAYPTE